MLEVNEINTTMSNAYIYILDISHEAQMPVSLVQRRIIDGLSDPDRRPFLCVFFVSSTIETKLFFCVLEPDFYLISVRRCKRKNPDRDDSQNQHWSM